MTLKKRLQNMDRLSDRQLVDLLLANDEDAIEYVFFHRCNDMFAHVINGIFHEQVKKEELVTDFYLYLRTDDWRRLRQFEFRSELNTWLTVVAIRFFNEKKTALQTGIAEDKVQTLEAVEQIADDYDLFSEISRVELYKAVESLPKPRERMALLGELAGKRAEAIASELGLTVSAVYKLIKKAKVAVAKIMKGNEQ